MAVRIKLPGGTLKMKVYRELRERERARRIPVLKMGDAIFHLVVEPAAPIERPTECTGRSGTRRAVTPS
jgi:hypothetical protein